MAVYTWGLGKTGQLGTGRLDTEYMPQLANKTAEGLELETAKYISCGALFTAVVTVDGNVFTTGYGKYGRLGLGDTENDACFFTEVSIFDKVHQVSCGSWHAAAVTDNGQVYIWGYKKACGDCLLPESGAVNQAVSSMLGNPSLVPFDVGVRVAGVSCGHNYTFVWSTNGNVFSWGSGHYGVLGHGSEDDVLMPMKVEHLMARAVVTVGAGHDHCGIVTKDGLLFMTGKGSDGALGLGPSQLQLMNALLPVLCRCKWKITAVSCSKGEHHAHTLALTEEGQVLSWGDGCKGKLGLGDEDKRFVPTLVSPDHFHNETVISVSAGGIHSAAATSEGSVYTWGCGSDGRLGHPEGFSTSHSNERLDIILRSSNNSMGLDYTQSGEFSETSISSSALEISGQALNFLRDFNWDVSSRSSVRFPQSLVVRFTGCDVQVIDRAVWPIPNFKFENIHNVCMFQNFPYQ